MMPIRHLENVPRNLNMSMFAFEKIRCHDLKLGACTYKQNFSKGNLGQFVLCNDCLRIQDEKQAEKFDDPGNKK